jgi:putative membrane protein insertion efficiency factor
MAESQTHPSRIVKALRGLIRIYQWQSPFWGQRCRFYPSCSEYTRDALLQLGLFHGLWRGLLRVTKCHPWHPGGVDLVRNPHAK